MDGAEGGRSGTRLGLALGLAALMLPSGAAPAQTTNAWVPASGNADWNTAANWNPASVPDAAAAVAIFTNTDYAVGITNTLSADVTVNGIVFNDYGAGDAQLLRIQGRQITFGGTAPFLSNSNDFGGQIILASTTRVSGVTLTLGGRQGCNSQLQGPFVGNGTLLARDGNWELMGLNSNFTGRIVVSNFTGNGYFDGRGSGLNAYWYFGDTNEATHIHGNGFVRALRDGGSTSNAEPFHLYGMNANGSVRFYANTNCTYLGAVTLFTNGVINYSQWFPNAEAPVGARKDLFFNGSVVDDENARHLFVLNDTGGGLSSTGTLSRTSRMVLGGEFRHGGFTWIGNSKNTDGAVEYSGWLELTNANNRLPVGTTLYLGGRTNVDGIAIGAEGANGVLILAGADQELAGLQVLGTGTQSRVIGGVPTNNTLTLNIPALVTNRFRGILGGAGVNENNVALTKTGEGVLVYDGAAAHTLAGMTTVSAGTLALAKNNGIVAMPGDVTIRAGGTLGVISNLQFNLDVTDVTIDGGTLDVQGSGYRGGMNTIDFRSGTIVDGDGGGLSQVNVRAALPHAFKIRGGLTCPIHVALDNGGTLNGLTFDPVDNGTAVMSGPITLAYSDKTITAGNGTADVDLRISGPIGQWGGTAGFTKLGNGTLELTAANTYGGTTTVSVGRLLVNNAAGSGTGTGRVTVGAGGTLGGTGAIAGAVTVAAGAKFAAGNSVGTNTVGSLTLTAGSTFEVEADGAAVDQTISLGPVDLGGATLSTVALSAPTFASARILSNATGEITGRFAGLYEADQVLIGGIPYYIHYRPTYVELNLTPTAVVLVDFAVGLEGGKTVIRWRTASEVNTAGFAVERLGADGTWARLNGDAIPANGFPHGGIGADYSFADPTAVAGEKYTWRLVEITTHGAEEIYGPYERIVAQDLKMTDLIVAGPGGLTLRWLSQQGESYRVLRSTDLAAGAWAIVARGLAATPPGNEWTDPQPAASGVYKIERETP